VIIPVSKSGQVTRVFKKCAQIRKKQLTFAPKGSKLTPEIGRSSADLNRLHKVGRGNNMSLRQRNGFKALAVILAFTFAQVYVQTGFAEPKTGRASIPVPQALVARITFSGGGAGTVNGASASSGATILTGSAIETPDQVSATIDLGSAGTIEVQPNSSILLDFADDGTVRVKVLRGCVKVNKKGPGDAEVYTAEGASEKTNSNRKKLGFCYLNGTLNSMGSTAAAGGAVGGGLSTAAKVAIIAGIAGGTTAIVLGTRGGNPSP
jgi:hypothetical protein